MAIFNSKLLVYQGKSDEWFVTKNWSRPFHHCDIVWNDFLEHSKNVLKQNIFFKTSFSLKKILMAFQRIDETGNDRKSWMVFSIWFWLTVCHGISQFLIGKLEFLWAIYTMAMLNKQRVSSFFICPVICVQFFWGGLPSTHFRTNRYHAVRYLFHYLHCIPTVVGFKPVSLLVKSHWEPDDVPIKLLET
jgi:hypothetical protein